MRKHRAKSKMNIKDIARLAGVSVGAASMALNDKWDKKVRPDVVERVKEVAAEHGYQINPLGKGLHMNRFFKIAVFIRSNPSSSRVIGAFSLYDFMAIASDKLARSGYSLDVSRLSPDALAANGGSLPTSNDAMLFIGWNAEELERLLDEVADDKPCLAFGANPRDSLISSVRRDTRAITAKIIDYLIDNGHRRIGFLKSVGDPERYAERSTAYRERLAAAGIEIAADLTRGLASETSLRAGHVVAEEFFALESPPTAIFCEDNIEAIGLQWYCDQHGIQVPEDVEIIGYGDEGIANMSVKPLSYIRIPSRETVDFAINHILERLDDPVNVKPKQARFPETIVWGETTRRRR